MEGMEFFFNALNIVHYRVAKTRKPNRRKEQQDSRRLMGMWRGELNPHKQKHGTAKIGP